MEQRISKRVRKQCLVRYRKRTLFVLEGGDVLGELMDISQTGARIKSYATLQPSEKITLIVPHRAGEPPLSLPGAILWVRSLEGRKIKVHQAGVRFGRLPDATVKVLHRFVFGERGES